MKSKTLKLIEQYRKDLLEQADPTVAPEGEVPMEDPAATPAPEAEQEPQVLQMTTAAEDEYIKNIIDAALFEPSSVSPEQTRALLDLQEIMMNKDATDVTNARADVYPVVMSIIGKEPEERGFKKIIGKVE